MDTKRIAKIEKLENDFDLVRSVADDLDGALYDFAAVQRRIERLFQYQESGEWQKDFEADEKGELPKNMKRGILSEDALDELLTDVTILRERIKELVSDVKVGKNEELLGFEEYDPLVDEPESIPEEAGSYIVVCREEGEGFGLMAGEPQEFEGQDAIYVGSSDNLREVADLFKGNAIQTPLRLVIGALHYLNPVKTKAGNRFSAEDERRLSKWMKENLLVYWQANPDHEKVTKLLLDELDPALNFDHESPELENFRKHLKLMMDNCIVDEDYEKVNTEEKIVRLPRKGTTLASAVAEVVADNAGRIPDKFGVGHVETLITRTGDDEGILGLLFGGLNEFGEKENTLIFYPFSFNKKALKEFLSSDYGKAFESDDEEYEFTFKAGDPELNKLIVTLLEKYCGLTDKSKLVMKTVAEVFR